MFWTWHVNRGTLIAEPATSVSVGKVSENESHDHGRVFEPAAFDFTRNALEAAAVGFYLQFCEFVYRIIVRCYEVRRTKYQCADTNFVCTPVFKEDL